MTQRCFVGESEGPGSGRIRRNWLTAKGPLLSSEGTDRDTMWQNWVLTVKNCPDNKCLGERTINGKGELQGFSHRTYADVDKEVSIFRAGLAHIGLQPREHVALYSKNRSCWVIADLACQGYSCPTVPLYDTLGPTAAAYVLNHGDCVIAVCDQAGLDNVMNAEADQLRAVVVMPPRKFNLTATNIQAYDMAVAKYANASRKVFKWDEIISFGSASPIAPVPPSGKDLATICYTSGTTGTPKGAMVTHEGMMSDIIGGTLHSIKFMPNDTYLSYLPLAHMYERLMIHTGLAVGLSCGFFRGEVLLLLEDLAVYQPTVFAGVPRLYNRIYDKILAGVNESGFLKRGLFNWALSSKLSNLESYGTVESSWDFAFKKIREALGGRVRTMATGSAPISDRVMQFLRVGFSCSVLEGYGQTETAGCATCTVVDDQKSLGHVGVPIPSCEIKLVDVPEMNYTSNDVVNGKKVERGEICFRGPIVTKGYYKMPEKTAETIDSDGWLHSGDIGMWLPDGYLKIIDRKKNIFKLSQGEYVAPEKIENVYTTSRYIAQAFVYGNSLKPNLVAILVPDEETILPWCKEKGVKARTLAEACQSRAVRDIIRKELVNSADEMKLHGFERAREFTLYNELFSVDNGILTPTFKLKRPIAKKMFASDIERMYAELAKRPTKSKL